MTVESAPVRLRLQSAPRRRLSLPAIFATMRAPAMLLACACTVCALGACSARDADSRVALTADAARELAQAQPGNAQSPPPASAFALASDAASSNPPDGATPAALPANAVRSPEKPSADAAAQAAQNEPLAPPVIHTVD
ncbi:hypothetical protein [Paraburkholderia lycopersici]|uniref:Uncharacterized protein n=1 Tax=Paraburkholderia lycopersici TaxID=416944 RepID=A0A1G6PYF5_9BURK|nr:hypothetical protein [Paraburkholderia lycopersici]SDC85242.1 hypothetical protein SAMN05421548_11122 [Paraburkholderia lycopersici]